MPAPTPDPNNPTAPTPLPPPVITFGQNGFRDIRTATVLANGKIIIGGSFQITATNVLYNQPEAETPILLNVTWRNIARLNADGTLDFSFISPSAVNLALAGGTPGGPNPTVRWGADGAVYALLAEQTDPERQYLVAGDFLNFSHNDQGNPVTRKRYLTLSEIAPTPALPSNVSEPLVALTAAVADGDGFNAPVRKLRRLIGTAVAPDRTVPNLTARLALLVPIGTRVLQTDNGFIYEKITGSAAAPTVPSDWIVLPGGRQVLFFATGDFTSFADSTDERYITRFTFQPGGITLPAPAIWSSAPVPDARVWDVATLGSQIFFVGDFQSLAGGQILWRGIGVINENGALDTATFNPGSGFNNHAYAIVADPIGNSVVVGGAFTNYDGTDVGYLARINFDGSLNAAFPAPNNGNDSGANGPIRAVTRQPDGRLFIAGEFTQYNGIPRSGVARLESDGSLDLTFVPAGDASGVLAFASDIDGGPGTASLFARPIVVGNFQRLFRSNLTGIARLIGGSYPVIWFQPNQITPPHVVNLGGNLALNVVAADNFVGFPGLQNPPFVPPQQPSEPLMFQWQRNGKDIQGAVGARFVIANASLQSAGNYRVRIYNSQFSIFSEQVRVTTNNAFAPVLPPAGIQVQGTIAPSPNLNGGLGGTISVRINRFGQTTGFILLANADGRPARHAIRGQYNFLEGLTVEIPRGSNQTPLTLRLQTDLQSASGNFDFTGPDNVLSDAGEQTASIAAWSPNWSRFNPATAFAGNYNIALETDPGNLDSFVELPPVEQPQMPQGAGLLRIRVIPNNGRVNMGGVLADGTRFTSSAVLWADASGTVPVFIPLYRQQGALTGQLSIESGVPGNPVLADLLWSKPAGVNNTPSSLFGFTSVPVTASDSSGLYDPSVIFFPWFLSLDFDTGAWAEGFFSADFEVNGGRVAPDPLNPIPVRLALNTRLGNLSGNYREPDAFGMPRPARYQAIITTANGFPEVRGFFLIRQTAQNPQTIIGGNVSGF